MWLLKTSHVLIQGGRGSAKNLFVNRNRLRLDRKPEFVIFSRAFHKSINLYKVNMVYTTVERGTPYSADYRVYIRK